MASLNKTDFQFMLVEAIDASQVPFVAGQYIVQDDGKAFYDPSTGTSADNRIELSTDLSAVLSKNFASKLITGISAQQTAGTNDYVFTVTTVNPEDNSTSSEAFTVTIDVALEVKADDSRPVSSDAVKTYVDTAIEGVKTIAENSSCEVYKVTGTGVASETIEDLLSDNYPDATFKKGDIAILTVKIVGDNESVTGYIYDGVNWAGMDGNYSAANVFLPSDILLSGSYTAVGNVSKGTTAATKNAGWEGMSMAAILDAIFSQVLYPSAVTPSVSMSLSNAGAKEIGTSITPSFTVTFDPKTYAYGSVKNSAASSSTYAEPSTVTLTTSAGETLTGTMTPSTTGAKVSLTLKGAEIVVSGTTSYKGTDVSCVYGDGAIPYTNTKAEYADAQVKGSTATNSTDTSAISGYREGFFYGTLSTVKAASALTSADIRGLSKSNTSYSAGFKAYVDTNADGKNDTTMVVPVGAATIVLAWPSNKTGITEVLNTTVNANMTTSFTTATLTVAGADNDPDSDYAEEYTVATFSPAEAYGSTANLSITLG